MRMRKKKHRDERLSRCEDYLYRHGGAPLSDPAGEIFGVPYAPVYLEIGAGKGGFACGMAAKHPDVCYIAMERVTDCVVLASERAGREGLCGRLKFLIDSADNLTRIFGNCTVDRIYLNFSDPWSKKGYAKRRLTHRRYLAVYMNLLKDGGVLQFKTDNSGLFDFSLEEIRTMGLTPDTVTRDLHASEWSADNVVTEYEAAFSSQGVKIKMFSVTKPRGFLPEIPEDLRADRKDYRSGDNQVED